MTTLTSPAGITEELWAFKGGRLKATSHNGNHPPKRDCATTISSIGKIGIPACREESGLSFDTHASGIEGKRNTLYCRKLSKIGIDRDAL